MNTNEAQKYLYKKLLKSFKNKSWKILYQNDNIPGTNESANTIISGYSYFKLVNPELNIYLKTDLSESGMKKLSDEHKDYFVSFRFNPEVESDFCYWYKNENGFVRTSHIYFKTNFLQRIRLRKQFTKMVKEIYEMKFEKTFSHSMDNYMKRNKAIFRDQRLNEILGDKSSSSTKETEEES